MVKITMIAPFAELKALSEKVFAEHCEFVRQQALDEEEYDFRVVSAATTPEALASDLDADVVIARGTMAYDLIRSHFSTPVVELLISGEDLITILHQFKSQYGNARGAIIGSDNMILGAADIARQIGVTVTPYYLKANTQEEIYRNVSQAINDGSQVILGGIRGCIYARSLGIPHILLDSGRNSIWNAITAAKQLGVASRKAQEEVLTLSAMVDNAFEGLIALDQQGNISAINQSARKILDLPEGDWCLGRSVQEVLRSPQIARLVAQTSPSIDEIIAYRNTHLSFKKLAVYLRGEVVGYVLTFLNAVQIQETEGKLRGKLYHKGHTAKYTFGDILGKSPAICECIRRANAFARTNSNIIIFGESGTGKELFSQSIHNASLRQGQAFVAVNCAAIPENLLESELFGYVGGAFTGANKEGKPGLFEIAHNGTLFLDEISEMPLALQGRLLRVLQEREIMRLGHDKVIPIDVRIIAATNKDLHQLVQKGLFREDLYYRINVLGLSLPPLRKRDADATMLAQHYIDEFCEQQQCNALHLSPDAAALIRSQSWPGNIRQLRNFCERLVVLWEGASLIESSALAAILLDDGSHYDEAPVSGHTLLSPALVQETLQATDNNKTLAAKRLGVSRVTLWRQMKQWEQAPEDENTSHS